ncbi:unnamed protein product [Spirodela intermedia]|uniref:Uncharacterized protein n=1 Tax=Spirodela intermedia TaxID=51605 RepID=A0A7I8JRM0_SPIIN|nr:unnamed protein product [Spirodela intermedia]CAA6672213.1 unnamed protein product [Spirodela intermedia]
MKVSSHFMAPMAPPPTAAHHTGSAQQSSPWNSPVRYLFGGMAVILGLIAFALLFLACSYWKLSADHDGGDNSDGDVESGDGRPRRIVVIMAGNDKPIFLATPRSAPAFCFPDVGSNVAGRGVDQADEEDEKKAAAAEQQRRQEGTQWNLEEAETRENQN